MGPPDVEERNDGRLRERKWPVWRGSQELLLRVARVATQYVSDHEGSAAPMRLSVRVGEDVEEFTTIEEFKTLVTPEALRSFRQIRVDVGDVASLRISVSFEREGWLMSTGRVRLVVESSSKQVSKAAEEPVKKVLDRGCTRFGRAWRSPELAFLAVIPLVAGVLSVLGFEEGRPGWVVVGGSSVVFIVSWLAFLEVVPSVEVAPPSKTRFARTTGVVIGLGLGLLGAALAAWVFGD